MSRKHCRRRIIKPVNPITLAMEGAAFTSSERLDKLRVLELAALEQFKAGQATVDDWRVMADVINVCDTFARSKVGEEALPAIARAEAALAAGHARFKAHGRIGRAAGEYEALLDVYEFHDLQRQSVSRSEYEAAIKRTADRIRSAAPDVRVYIA